MNIEVLRRLESKLVGTVDCLANVVDVDAIVVADGGVYAVVSTQHYLKMVKKQVGKMAKVEKTTSGFDQHVICSHFAM